MSSTKPVCEALNSSLPLFFFPQVSDNADQMCVFIGNLSSKILKCHTSLMTYDLKFLLLRTNQHTMAFNEGVTKAVESLY